MDIWQKDLDLDDKGMHIFQIDSIVEQSFDNFDTMIKLSLNKLQEDLSDVQARTRMFLRERYPEAFEPGGSLSYHYSELGPLYWEQCRIDDQMVAISGMKIVYLFKDVESRMKALIIAAYPENNSKGLHQWDNMKSFFSSFEINISELNGYNDVDQLRKVNNCIKHSDGKSDDVKRIVEFKEYDIFTFEQLESFYTRVKPLAQQFIKHLSEKIIADQYSFSEDRITKISDNYSFRMNLEELTSFINKLTEQLKYKQ